MQNFLSIPVESITLGEPIPVKVYVFVQGRFILFREELSILTPAILQRFQQKHVTSVFVREEDRTKMIEWITHTNDAVRVPKSSAPFFELREQTVKQLADTFEVPDTLNEETLKKFAKQGQEIVRSMLRSPLTQLALTQLQNYSITVLEHSLNVAFLAVYCASQMGYDHRPILENIALGALLHDLGQSRVKVNETDSDRDVELKLRQHPVLAGAIFDEAGLELPLEVQLIVAQHHEYADGSGFPKGMKGPMIYDLARIVSLINFYDQLVRATPGPWAMRQKRALTQLNEEYSHLFEPAKLEKVTRILEQSLAIDQKPSAPASS